jgi:hypothetical protein
MRGTMVWFNEEKGHGYISTETGERLYVSEHGFRDGIAPKGRPPGRRERARRGGPALARPPAPPSRSLAHPARLLAS